MAEMLPARWFRIRRTPDGSRWVVQYRAEVREASGDFVSSDLAEVDELRRGLRRLGYSEHQ